MRFGELVRLAARLRSTRGRLNKISWTAEVLRSLTVEEVPWAVAFLTGRPFPAADPRVLEVGWPAVAAAERSPPGAGEQLSLLDVAEAFARIAAVAGKGSRQGKEQALAELYARASEPERQTIAAILHGEMRIGLHDGLIQEAIARAYGADLAVVRRGGLFLSDLAEVARVAAAEGTGGLERVGIRLFVPLLPMLSELAADFEEVLKAHHGRTALEYKYDGARIQIHKKNGTVRIWSRRLTEVTESLPDVAAIARDLRAESFIADGEVVAVDRDGRPLPFQELMRRFRRVHDLERTVAEIPLRLFLFDCLFLNGSSLIDAPYEERWAGLRSLTSARYLAERLVTGDPAAARAFLEQALRAGHEGVMAKDPASVYAPGSRGKRWYKIKPAITVDCVVVAADRGSGRRRGWLSNYHLAVADESRGFVPVGKTFKGLTDREFGEMTERLKALQTGDDGYTVTVAPEIVVEVAFNEIQRSPQYRSGFALRFARIVRIRDDKRPEQATTLAELRALYERQFLTKGRYDL